MLNPHFLLVQPPSFLLNGTPSSLPRGPVDAHTRLVQLQGEAAGDVLRAAEGSPQRCARCCPGEQCPCKRTLHKYVCVAAQRVIQQQPKDNQQPATTARSPTYKSCEPSIGQIIPHSSVAWMVHNSKCSSSVGWGLLNLKPNHT